MSEERVESAILIFSLIFLGVVCAISATFGYQNGKESVQDEAVARGVGEFVIKDRGVVFKWKEPRDE